MTDLTIILGSPASGKTTLACRVSADLALPCLCKDDVKEALLDVLGVADRTASRRLSDASFAALLRLAHTQLEAGLSCIIEGNWRAEHAAGVLAITAALGTRIAQVCCRANPAEIARRFSARTRHPGHLDAGLSGDEIQRFSEAPTAYLDLPGPRWIYDCDDPASYRMLLHSLHCWRL